MFTIDHDFSSIIIESTTDVFETMIFMELEPYPDMGDEERILAAMIKGIINVEGKYSGKVMVCCSASMASVITANLLGIEPEDPEVKHRIKDTVGEIANMIAGNIKSRMSEEEDAFDLHPPEVVLENDFPVKRMNKPEGVIVPFFSEDEYLWVEVILE